MKKPLGFFLLFLYCFIAYGQSTVVSKLKNYTSNHTSEKAYLHFDKPYYAAGDTIYFKAYVTLGERHQLSDLSGVLHVNLINPGNKIGQEIKLPLMNGLAWGDFVLADTLAPGNYRIKVYTRWMLNDGNLFEQTIPIGSVQAQKVPENSTVKSVNTKPDLQFCPESGRLIAGLPARVAFKAIGTNGLGIGVKGTIADDSGTVIERFESSHLGMGSVSFTPEAGKSYKANVIFADGSKNNLDLPLPVSKGIALSVNNDSLPKAEVKILSNTAYYNENKGKGYTLLIYSGGSATTVPIKLDSPAISLNILKRRLHTGIASITLFSDVNEPLCERLIFVQNYDKLNLNVTTDKGSYATREKVSIKLNVKTRADSAAMGHFSVAVIDESKVPVNENEETTILSNLLLTSDLKGTVEQPNYYFNTITSEKLKELDLVMLTHGYRRFEWKQVLNNSDQSLAYQPEKSLEITGQVKNLSGRPLPKASVALISFEPKSLTSTMANDKGEFVFDHLSFTDSARFVLQAVNAKGGNKTKLSYNLYEAPSCSSPVSTYLPDNEIPVAYLENNEKQQEELNKPGLGRSRLLKEIKIKAKKSIPTPNPKYGIPDQVVSGNKILYGGQLSTRLAGLIHFHQHFNKPVLVVWNGVEMPRNFDINSINTGSIESIEVFTNALGPDYDNVLSINTTFGLQTKDMIVTGILPITVQGYQKVREFYSPKYESGITYNHPDLRTTIYWKPELITDKNGNASFDFYNADGIGTYRIVIEGIDEKGNLARQVYRYRVD